MKRHNLCIIFLLPLILISLPHCRQQNLGAILQREIPKLMEVANIQGLSMAVIRDGEIIWSGNFGVRSRETNELVDENTIFEAASLTKTVTAVAALKLVERGEIDLDKPLAEYLPYPKLARDERYKKITARHVLTHTTGLPNWGTRLIREPGELYGYSGEGFLYLGRTIEKITGMSLQEFTKKEIFEPLGMARTSYVWNNLYDENGASGHDRHGFANQKRKRTEPNGGASLLTTALDYAAFLCSIMNNQVLEPRTIDLMLTPHVRAAKRRDPKDELDEYVSWGFGWGIQPGNKENGFWHWGDNGDLRAYTVSYGERKEGLVFFANSENLFLIAEPLISLVLDDPQHSFNWLTYKRIDDPERVARMAVEKTFLEEGKKAGLKKTEEMKNQFPEMFEITDLNIIARYLASREKADEAEAILKWIIDSDPKSVIAWAGLGRLYFETGRNKESFEHLQKTLEWSPKNSYAKMTIPWIKDLIQVEENPVLVSEATLKKYAGDYGPRHVYLREGRLYYQRDGRKEYKLIPLNQDTFALVGYGVFRLRFILDKSGNVTKVMGVYLGGRTDESLRNKTE
ncbi:MAG: serine hydrolase [Candidatus Aminicenantes bacterium]|nr:MAG: serine hydrolase [Candidatus Aminicenantes bacterium]